MVMLLKCGFFFPEELHSPVARRPIHLTLCFLLSVFCPGSGGRACLDAPGSGLQALGLPPELGWGSESAGPFPDPACLILRSSFGHRPSLTLLAAPFMSRWWQHTGLVNPAVPALPAIY